MMGDACIDLHTLFTHFKISILSVSSANIRQSDIIRISPARKSNDMVNPGKSA